MSRTNVLWRWRRPREQPSAHVGGIELKGVHILRFNDAGQIVDIDLIARPASGVMALGNGVVSKIGPQVKVALVSARQTPAAT